MGLLPVSAMLQPAGRDRYRSRPLFRRRADYQQQVSVRHTVTVGLLNIFNQLPNVNLFIYHYVQNKERFII